MNELTKALKDVIGKGTTFCLKVKKENLKEVVLSVTGGISDITLRLPFDFVGVVDFDKYNGFDWQSSRRTLDTLSAAIEAIPEDASPTILLDAQEWDGAGLILKATLTKKGRGRSKEVQEQNINLLFDAGVLLDPEYMEELNNET